MPRPCCSVSLRFKGHPRPIFSKAIMLPTVASHFSRPHPAAKSGVGDRAAQIAAQLLEIINLGAHEGLADQPHHHTRTLAGVNGSRFALRAPDRPAQARSEGHFDLLGGRVSIGPIADVTRVPLGCWTWLRRAPRRSRGRRRLRIVPGLGTAVGCRTAASRASSPAGASPPGNAARAALLNTLGGCCPTTIAVFSVFALKRIFRSRAMVVFLLPTA